MIWSHARARSTGEGPFLFGAFSAVDAFFAPVASRIATYGLEMDQTDAAYVAAVLDHPSVRRWRAMGIADGHVQAHYEFDLPARANPHDPAVAGQTVGDDRVAANEFCPFTGPTSRRDAGSRWRAACWGLGDAFTRDKVAADPYCWPEIAALLPAPG